MTRALRIVALLAAFGGVQSAVPASAQTTGEQKAADVARWIVAGVAIAADASECPHSDNQKRCWITLAVRQGVVQGASIGIAAAFPRLRPCAPACGIDSPNNDVPSRHTAMTAATFPLPRDGVGYRFVVAASATTLVGILSGMATKHDLLGVATGAAVGYVASFIR